MGSIHGNNDGNNDGINGMTTMVRTIIVNYKSMVTMIDYELMMNHELHSGKLTWK